MKNINESNDLELVKAYFEENNFSAERFYKNEISGKNPDYKVNSRDSGYFFFCEVKSIDTEVTESGLLTNRVFNIYADKIHESVKQFNAVNPKHIVPNVLAFVTRSFQMNWNRFSDFLQGFTIVGRKNDKYVIAELKKVSNSRIKYDLRQIDLFLYFQGTNINIFPNTYDNYHSGKLIGIFGTDDMKIKRIRLG